MSLGWVGQYNTPFTNPHNHHAPMNHPCTVQLARCLRPLSGPTQPRDIQLYMILLLALAPGKLLNYVTLSKGAWIIPAWIWDLFREEVKNEEKIRVRSTDQQLLLGHFILRHFIFKLFALRHFAAVFNLCHCPVPCDLWNRSLYFYEIAFFKHLCRD